MDNNLPHHITPHSGMPGLKSLIIFLLLTTFGALILLLTGSFGSVGHVAIVASLSAALGWVIWTICGWLPLQYGIVSRLRYIISGGLTAYMLITNVAHPQLASWDIQLKKWIGSGEIAVMPALAFIIGALIALSMRMLQQKLSQFGH